MHEDQAWQDFQLAISDLRVSGVAIETIIAQLQEMEINGD